MSFFDKIKNAVNAEKPADGKAFVFDTIPTSLEEFKARPEADLKDPDGVVALAVIAFNIYPVNEELSLAMLNFLKGPSPLSNQDKALIKEQLRGKDYLPRSYFVGATPDNNYEPSEPCTVVVRESAHSRDAEGYYTAYIRSGGADNDRPMTVRLKPSTGEWFLFNHVGFLPGIRVPANQNPWA
jgi:hypothetical protein